MDHPIVKPSSRQKGRFLLSGPGAARLAMCAIGFFMGRAVVFDVINPAMAGFLASMTGAGFSFYASAAFLALGAATKLRGAHLARYAICALLLCAVNAFARKCLPKKSLHLTGLAQALSGAGCMLAAGLSVALAGAPGMLPVALLEPVLAFFMSYVLCKASNVLTAQERKPMLGTEDMISLAVLFACIIAGASDIYIGPVSLRYTLCFYFVLTAAWLGDGAIASAAGTLAGLMPLIGGAGRWNAGMAVTLSLAGLAGGLGKSRGKQYELAAFAAAGGGAFFFLNRGLLDLGAVFSLSFAGLLFLATPPKFNFFITAQFNPDAAGAQGYASKISEMAAGRLNACAGAFNRLSRLFGDMAAPRARLDKHSAAKLIDGIASDVCAECAKRAECWEGDFYSTYQHAFGLLAQCGKKGRADANSADPAFKSQCINLAGFVGGVNALFELHSGSVNALGPELISQQLAGVSGVIKNLAAEMESGPRFNEELEGRVAMALAKNNIEADQVTIFEDKRGRYEVNVRHRLFSDKQEWNRAVTHLLNSALNHRMEAEGGEKKQVYATRFIEERPLAVKCGVSRAAKGGSGESGDSYSFMDLKCGQTLMILSDGMGTGKRARRESAAAVDLLVNFLESGFNKNQAVKIINSALALNGGDESFATLDICTVDLYTGDAEFIKLGAAPTYLLRGGKVSVIRSASLPIGMLRDVDMEISRKRLADGDVLVMVTDGVPDNGGDGWVNEALAQCGLTEPGEVAGYLLAEARRASGGETRDDMTVLAARVVEK